jgi:hypothetical protein
LVATVHFVDPAQGIAGLLAARWTGQVVFVLGGHGQQVLATREGCSASTSARKPDSLVPNGDVRYSNCRNGL